MSHCRRCPTSRATSWRRWSPPWAWRGRARVRRSSTWSCPPASPAAGARPGQESLAVAKSSRRGLGAHHDAAGPGPPAGGVGPRRPRPRRRRARPDLAAWAPSWSPPPSTGRRTWSAPTSTRWPWRRRRRRCGVGGSRPTSARATPSPTRGPTSTPSPATCRSCRRSVSGDHRGTRRPTPCAGSWALPYADVAGLMLLRAIDVAVRPGGRVVGCCNRSRCCRPGTPPPVRGAAAPHLEGLWVADEPVFGAQVRVGAGLGTSAASAPLPRPTVRRWQGVGVRPAGRATRPTTSSWNRLRPATTPKVRCRYADGGRHGHGHRRVPGRVLRPGRRRAGVGLGHPLVTSGLIDPGRIRWWGERPARIASGASTD